MITITAVIRARPGGESRLRRALRDVADQLDHHEAQTIGLFVSQDLSDPRVFTTGERFVDAMARHNASSVVAAFFGIARELLDGSVTRIRGHERPAQPATG